MIMPRGEDQLLLPVNPLFVAFTLLVALALNMVPLGRVPMMPSASSAASVAASTPARRVSTSALCWPSVGVAVCNQFDTLAKRNGSPGNGHFPSSGCSTVS